MKLKRVILGLLAAVLLLQGAGIQPAFAAGQDFVVQNGMLVKYNGPGGEVVIPAGVERIGQMVFCGNKTITGVTIPEGVTSIQNLAFDECTNLARVSLPQSLKMIGDGAFFGCDSLRSVVIPDGVTELGGAFKSNKNLTDVTLPKHLEKIYDTFEYCSSLAHIELPETVKVIGYGTFLRCTALKSIRLPDGLEELGDDVFLSSGLEEVNIPAGVKTFGQRVFDNTPWIRNHYDGDFLIANGSLLSYKGRASHVTVPDGVTRICAGVFGHHPELTSVSFPDTLRVIGDFAFIDTGLKEVEIPEGVTRFNHAFQDCASLTYASLPSSANELYYAFQNCPNLAEVVLPEHVGGAMASALEGTPWLATQRAGDFAISDGILLYYYGNGGNVVVPDGVTSIAAYAFSNLERSEKILSIRLPDTVRFIEDRAFTLCYNLREINFPAELQWISPNAFMQTGKYFSREFEVELVQRTLGQWMNPAALISPQSERVTRLAKELTAGISSDYEKARAISQWICNNIRYDHSYRTKQYEELAVTAEAVLDTRLTICEGYSNLTRAMLQAVGIPTIVMDGPAYGADGWIIHGWNAAWIDGRWVHMDNTWGMRYFDIPLEEMMKSRDFYDVVPQACWKDTPSFWAQPEALEAINSGLVADDLQAGYHVAATREEFCRLMVSMLEQASGMDADQLLASRGLTRTAPFTDTDSDEIAVAYSLGIVKGASPTTFRPDGSITRQEAAVMLTRTARLLGLTAAAPTAFQDGDRVASWAAEGVAFVSGLTDSGSGNKVMGGTGDGCFSPLGKYTREQAIVTALRLFHCV